MSTSSFGSTWARNHCSPPRSLIGSATPTHLERELLDPQEKFPDTRNPPSASIEVAFGSRLPQHATGPWPNTSRCAAMPVPVCTNVLAVLEISTHQPAEPSARAISSVASNSSTPLPLRPPAEPDREQVGIQHGGRDLIGQPPEALRRKRLALINALIAFARSSGRGSVACICRAAVKPISARRSAATLGISASPLRFADQAAGCGA